MKPINAVIVNNEKMSSLLERDIAETVRIILLSFSDSGRYILATDTIDYIVFKKWRFDEKKNEGVFEFVSAEPITRSDNFRMINKYIWKEESGYVSMFYGGLKLGLKNTRVIFNEELFNRTECAFVYRKSVSKQVPFNGTDFECTIRNRILDKDIPDEIKQILFNLHKRTFENGVFRFYEYSALEQNASDFLDTGKNTNVSYGMIFNPRFLYDTICEAYGIDKNSNAEFGLVFSIDDSCLLTLETNMKAGKSE